MSVPVTESGGPAARRSKANEEARLVEGKVALFWMPATSGVGEGGRLSKGRLPPPRQSGGKSFYRRREGAACRNSTASSDSHLENWSSVV